MEGKIEDLKKKILESMQNKKRDKKYKDKQKQKASLTLTRLADVESVDASKDFAFGDTLESYTSIETKS